MTKHPKRPRDANQLAKFIADLATGEAADAPDPTNQEKDPAAVSLGRKGGLSGGRQRAANMTADQRSEAARKAANKRWGKSTG